MTMMYKGKAKIQYFKSWIIAWTDKDIINYYYSLIPPAKYPSRPRSVAHITVVRMEPKETVGQEGKSLWRRHQNRVISFSYDGVINYQKPYFFLHVWSDEIGQIREELGLPKYRQGFDCYHITIGNTK